MSEHKLLLYSSSASQWASVPLLALLENEIVWDEYQAKDIDLVSAANFDPQYLRVNPNGTVPTLVAPGLGSPLVDSRDILRYLDDMRPSALQLQSKDSTIAAKAEQIIELVHSDRMSTNLILLQARDADEMRAK